ncbi:MAG TPA: TetR/AcrR family transcriptional regulator [Nocardioides sp.]|uniref:TetR/AcrR family transcriptional regulator n=1 Tax=Nocardioides sp. TaxID=35761 RepID=UPI002BCC9920|nr:TetR/AcrR family transcriptional regulator [Nocardioides sp.]HTW16684.1 TetR/AcrR family transcriptional regulator [Nocardioides sp.]
MSRRVRAPSPRWETLRDQQEAAVARAIIAIVAEDPSRLTVAEIAQRAEISRQTFYKQFVTLEAAVAATQGRVIAVLGSRIADVATTRPAANGLERLLQIQEAAFEVFTADPAMLRFTSFYDFSFRVHRMSEADREQHPLAPSPEGDAGLYELIRAGQRDGSIDPDLPVEATWRALSTSILGVIQRLQIQDDWTDGRDEAARETFATMLAVWRRTLSSS